MPINCALASVEGPNVEANGGERRLLVLARWAFGDPRPTELDPIVLLWWMRRRVRFDRIPRRRVVLQFEFLGRPKETYWLLVESTSASVCLKDPGFDVDLIVTADIAAFYRVWLGRSTLQQALRSGEVRLDGTPTDTRAFSRWFAWSPMADAVRTALAAPKNAAASGMATKARQPSMS